MAIHISDLPLKYQQQALAALNAPKKQSKHHNIKVNTVSGHKFDSKAEQKRFEYLSCLAAAGIITQLKLQPDFTLQEAYTTPEGERIRAVRYRADFSYLKGDRLIVEDVKSSHTRKLSTYRVKYKLMQEKLGITISEILNPEQAV